MEAYAFSVAGIFGISMLLSGIVLTVITIMRMVSGKIDIPGWSKVLLSIAMIAMLLVLVLGMLPQDVIKVTNPFVEEYTHIVTPSAPLPTEVAR